jgi:hypothetical protein
MKIILSRKGFDSQYGKQPSPILPDGTLLSLPIPSKDETVCFIDLTYKTKSYYRIIEELNPKTKIKSNYTCHLDPDLRKETLPRQKDWIPLFGQTDSAQGHLTKEGVKENDLFLFFGWFRQTEQVNGILRYKRNAPDLHIIFAYLQIGKMYKEHSKMPNEVLYHPHAHKRYELKKNNSIYRPSNSLSLEPSIKGSGCLKYHDSLVLTKTGYSRSIWNLPEFFKAVKISYHSNKSFYKDYFQSAAKGQEFVIEENKHVTEWAKRIIIKGTKA